jgi:PadR family transcriptional regulator, regulatory protein AphA
MLYGILCTFHLSRSTLVTSSKSERELPSSSYVILGLLATCGPRTPYELKKLVDGSIGYFWDFPRSQLYVDPERLLALGYLEEEREAEGRRRRTYHVTPAGLKTLRSWLQKPEQTEVEIRDAGLLKLYFGSLLDQLDLIALALRERDAHEQRLRQYQRIKSAVLSTHPEATDQFALATLEMGLKYEQISVEFWEEVAAHPPDAPRK